MDKCLKSLFFSTPDPNAECANTFGSFTCSCKQDFYGTGESCFRGKCSDSNCPDNQKCVSATTLDCECRSGFEMNRNLACVDVDECEKITCGGQANCSNTLGSYSCDIVTRDQTTTYRIVSTTQKTTITSFK